MRQPVLVGPLILVCAAWAAGAAAQSTPPPVPPPQAIPQQQTSQQSGAREAVSGANERTGDLERRAGELTGDSVAPAEEPFFQSPLPPIDTAAARAQAPQAQAPPAGGGEVTLVFDREVYLYPVERRRDPFTPLTGADDLGPRFEQLSLKGIIHSATPGRSVALLAGPGGRIFRVRQGDIVGNARVIDIEPLRVTFAVENFGLVRQERLELKRREAQGVTR